MRPGLELWAERVTLCDLLHGRMFRLHAAQFLDDALAVEALGGGAPGVSEILARAAHAEWIASISEQGLVQWGRRQNRCGSPESYLEFSFEPLP